MKTNAAPDRLLKYDQAIAIFHAAGLVDLTVKWLKNQCDNGKIKAATVNRHRRFKESDIKRMLSEMFADVC